MTTIFATFVIRIINCLADSDNVQSVGYRLRIWIRL